MNERKPHYSFHLAGILICLGLLVFTLNRLYYSKPEKSLAPGENTGVKADTSIRHQ